MPVVTRTVTVTLSDVDGTPLTDALVQIELVGTGNGPNGAVAPSMVSELTDSDGVATFTLWQNDPVNSDTYYRIISYHPESGEVIHRREEFVVGDSDADVKDLINLASVNIDVNQALLDQLAVDRAAAAQSLSDAQDILQQIQSLYAQGATNPVVESQSIEVVENIARIIVLGPTIDSDGQSVTYSSGAAPSITINGNMATFESAVVGQQVITITATDSVGNQGTGILAVDVLDSGSMTEYLLPGVSIS